jgi:hypothetical protein
MSTGIVKGVLCREDGQIFLQGRDGERFFNSERIWKGYVTHWLGRKVCARNLPQVDYETGRPLILAWPDEEMPKNPFVEVYFDERLRKYPASLLGHISINVNGEVFNYSHLMNENEVMTPEEYLYRPALGEFAPHPELGKYHVDEDGKAYYDKFGRLFMRTVHVLSIEGLSTDLLSAYYHHELEKILNTAEDPKKPGYYPHFNLFTRNCATIIRDGLRNAGPTTVKGVFPRDLFINMVCQFLKLGKKESKRVTLFRLGQLKVPEAPCSALPPPVNPINMLRLIWLRGTKLAVK